MKKLLLILGSLFLTVGFLLISFDGSSQNVKLTRQEQKEARKAALFANFQVLDTLFQRKDFVLKADFLENQYGDRIPVTSFLNFIKVDSTNVVLQTGSDVNVGYNGVGGVTAQGRLERFEIVKDLKHLSYSLQFSVLTGIGAYDVFMTVTSDNYARANITGLSRGKLMYEGHIEANSYSNTFKGQDSH